MRRFVRHIITAAAALSLGGAACSPERPSDRMEEAPPASAEGSERDRQPVAIVNGESIGVGEFERRIEGMAPHARARYSTREKRLELIDQVVVFEALADEAERRGLKDDPAVLHAMKDAMVRRLLLEEVRERAPLSAITEADVERAYRERIDEFVQPEQRRAAVIEVHSEVFARDLAAKFSPEAMPDLNARMLAFRKESAKSSVSPEVAKKGGDIGYVIPPDREREHIEIARRVFELDAVGQIASPYKHEGRWHIVMLTDIQPERKQSLEIVGPKLRQELYEERRRAAREAFIAELREQASVEIVEENLDAIAPPEAATPTLDPSRFGRAPVRGLDRRDRKKPADQGD